MVLLRLRGIYTFSSGSMGSMYSSHCLTTEKSLTMPVANPASIGVSCANVDT